MVKEQFLGGRLYSSKSARGFGNMFWPTLFSNWEISSWTVRPNPEDRINRKPDDQIYDWTTE